MAESAAAQAAAEPDWLTERRRGGAALTGELGLPGQKTKGWEFTDLSALVAAIAAVGIDTASVVFEPDQKNGTALELTASVAAQLDWSRVQGFATDAGSRTYHTAILARSTASCPSF